MSKKILIVEDEFIVAHDLQLMLQQAGYTVTGIAASSEEAEENIRNQKADIVLIDIRLQGKLSGIDLARKLRAENIAFVYLSANSSQQILEEARTTEPYGFLVKPFREKDLLITLDIAWYRHHHSYESKLRQEELLQKQLIEICNQHLNGQERVLNLAMAMQSFLPFDLLAIGTRPAVASKSSDIRFLRIGFDEYQFIGEKELETITGLKTNTLPVQPENNNVSIPIIIYNNDMSENQPGIPKPEKFIMKAFNMQSLIVFPVTLSNRISVHYFFYNRNSVSYNNSHISLLNRLKTWLTDLVEKIIIDETPATPGINQLGLLVRKQNEAVSHPTLKNIIGKHPLLLSALDLATQVAPYNTSILILGESGTGKEKAAELIHSFSPRQNDPFIKVNCASIPVTLMESELFGHEKGSFTGAFEKRIGKFEQAKGGTIFLDEIGELPFDMQAKLLRVLQEKEIEPVGGHSPVKVNVRIIAATNRNLEKEVAEGRFRLDLYYRLNVFPITLPALRDRKTDIDALTLFFANKFCKEFNKPFMGIAETMMEEMLAYSWPGNIRELENVVEQSVILNDGRSKLELKRSLTNAGERINKKTIENLEDVKKAQNETEKEYIISVLKKTNGRIRGSKGAAELLNIKPTTLESRISKLKISKEDFKNLAGN